MLGLKSSVGILKIHPCSWPELNKSHEIRVNRKMADRR